MLAKLFYTWIKQFQKNVWVLVTLILGHGQETACRHLKFLNKEYQANNQSWAADMGTF